MTPAPEGERAGAPGRPAVPLPWLRTSGSAVVDEAGREVRLRGVGIGGWLNMENFITGYPATESLHRRALRDRLGAERYERLVGSLLDNFFADADAAFIASLGFNAVRIPLNYHHLEDDMRPGELLPGCFDRLDGAVASCARHGIYSVIDLHALPGGQNYHWHSDNRFHAPLLFEHRDFQDRTAALWRSIAGHFRDEPAVAGYNLINEPADPEGRRLVALHDRLVNEIRAVDPRHTVFLDGNHYAQQFGDFGEPTENAVYALHQYPVPGSARGGEYPGVSGGVRYDRAAVERQFLERTAYMRAHDVPAWVGEFGPVYARDPRVDAMRRRLLADQIEIYEAAGAGWSLWTYKDIGVQGLVSARPDSPWMARTASVRAKKERLGADSWGMTGAGVADLVAPIVARMANEMPGFDPYPFGLQGHVELLVRNILLAEPLTAEFADAFADASDDELDASGASFALHACSRDDELCEVVARTG